MDRELDWRWWLPRLTGPLLMALMLGGAICQALYADWLEGGYVRIASDSASIELTGSPGGRIKLMLPLPANAAADYRETSAVMLDPSSGIETVTRLPVELDDEDRPKRVFAWLTVPDLEGDQSRRLNGTLSGYATTREGTVGRFEAPFTLQVEPRDRVLTSGEKDMTVQRIVVCAWAVAVVTACVGFTAGVAAEIAREGRAQVRSSVPAIEGGLA